MTTKRCITIIFALILALSLWGQNSIDRMVEDFSTSGSSSFTSVVQRNPKTRAVERVVKRLETDRHSNAEEIISTFKQEIKKHSYTTEKKGGVVSIVFFVEGAKDKRLYMLRYDDNRSPHWAEVTIIISMEKKGKRK